MNVYAYWNARNSDCKKIFHFLSSKDDNSIIPIIQGNNSIIVDEKMMYFSDCSGIMNNISQSDIVIFCTHGTPGEILKYRNESDEDLTQCILINNNNMNVLNNKIVLAFCCASARALGQECISNPYRCKAYVGFTNNIVYDNGHAQDSRHIIYLSYKIAFKKSLEYAVNTKCTVEQFRVNLLQNMRKESVKAIISSKDHTLNNMYAATISGLVALGEKNETMFA